MDFLRQKLGFSSSSSSSNNNNNNTSNTPLTVHDVYTFGKPVGEGAFSVVRLAKNSTTGQDVAIKCISRKELSPEDENSIRTEINIMKSLNHPNIVKFVDSFEEEKFFYVVLEFLPGGELFDRLVQKTFYNEKEARDTVRIICEGIKYCHDRGIVHRDLKPENLLMESIDDDAKVKIADFGFARCDASAMVTQCGTPNYVAPEVLIGGSTAYTKAVDMWSMGIIIFIILGGYPPFQHKNQAKLFQRIKKGHFEFHEKYWSHVSPEAKDLIRKLLELNTHKRLTATQALEHPWFKKEAGILSSHNLQDNQAELKKNQGLAKFRSAVHMVMAIERLARLGGKADMDDASKIIHEGMNEEGEDDEGDGDEETKSNQIKAMAILESSVSNLDLVDQQIKTQTTTGTEAMESISSSSVEQIQVQLPPQETTGVTSTLESSLDNITPAPADTSISEEKQ
mmetsp:Transcript_7514/g.7956  ORF Transcript_7514/g.7956 Transcript_7514/m.7956 type:complete len:453 (+) Transcript_7514:53-1411(+)